MEMNDNLEVDQNQNQIFQLKDELSNEGILRRYGIEIPEQDLLVV